MTGPKEDAAEPLPQLSEQDLHQFGRRLVRRRRARGWNQKELGLRVSIRPSRLSRLERGKVEPRLDELLRLRAVFGGTLDALIIEPEPSTSVLADLLRELEQLATPEEREMLSRMLHLLSRGIRREPSE